MRRHVDVRAHEISRDGTALLLTPYTVYTPPFLSRRRELQVLSSLSCNSGGLVYFRWKMFVLMNGERRGCGSEWRGARGFQGCDILGALIRSVLLLRTFPGRKNARKKTKSKQADEVLFTIRRLVTFSTFKMGVVRAQEVLCQNTQQLLTAVGRLLVDYVWVYLKLKFFVTSFTWTSSSQIITTINSPQKIR